MTQQNRSGSRAGDASSSEHASVILLYHSVQSVPSDPWGLRVSPRHFADHMAVLKSRTNPMSLPGFVRALREGQLPPRASVVTFDDGYVDNLAHALPAMRRHQVPGTVFVATGYVGSDREYWWDELDRVLLQPGRLPAKLKLKIGGKDFEWDLAAGATFGRFTAWRHRKWRGWDPRRPTVRHSLFLEIWNLMRRTSGEDREAVLQQLRAASGSGARARPTHRCVTLEELRELAADPLVEIGAHTVSHPSLGSIPAQMQHTEITESKAWLEGHIDRPITSFSYPFGTREDYSQETINILKAAGFVQTCSNFPADITTETDPYQLPRHVVQDWRADEFETRLVRWLGEK